MKNQCRIFLKSNLRRQYNNKTALFFKIFQTQKTFWILHGKDRNQTDLLALYWIV